MTWDQFIAGVLSLAMIALARLLDRYLPATHPETATVAAVTAGAPPPCSGGETSIPSITDLEVVGEEEPPSEQPATPP